MIQVFCKVDLVVNDVIPRVRLVHGKSHAFSSVTFHRSRILQDALRRGDISLVKGAARPEGLTTPSPQPRPRRAAKRLWRNSVQPPDMTEVSQVVEDLRSVHNLFVHLADEIPGCRSTDNAILVQLTELQTVMEGLEGRLDRIEARLMQGAVVGAPTATSAPLERTPTFIPSEIRTGSTKDVSIEVESKTEDSDLEEAEAALKKLKTSTPKPRKRKKRGADNG